MDRLPVLLDRLPALINGPSPSIIGPSPDNLTRRHAPTTGRDPDHCWVYGLRKGSLTIGVQWVPMGVQWVPMGSMGSND